MFGVAEALLGLETNPGPIKAAMSLLGWSVGQPRPPLSPLSEENTAKLTPLLEALDLNPMA
jgi:4-hydroxy-tetrahydrodipicolinate synthase